MHFLYEKWDIWSKTWFSVKTIDFLWKSFIFRKNVLIFRENVSFSIKTF